MSVKTEIQPTVVKLYLCVECFSNDPDSAKLMTIHLTYTPLAPSNTQLIGGNLLGMMHEFKEFAVKGHVVDIAVGIVIGHRLRKNTIILCRKGEHATDGCHVGGTSLSLTW